MANNGQTHLGSHPKTETTCDCPWCWCRQHHYGPHSSGNLISDGTSTWLYETETGTSITVAANRAALLYTQAQVDALVKAERERLVDAFSDRGFRYSARDTLVATIRSGK